MLFNVPQYIDVEDKVAGPLTAKQLLWMFGMGAVLLALWGILDKSVFFVTAVPVALIFIALAFYRPYNQPLIKFIFSGILFLFKPKVYIWKRTFEKKAIRDKNEKRSEIIKKKEKITPGVENIEMLARVLDSEGRERSGKIMEIIKRNKIPNS